MPLNATDPLDWLIVVVPAVTDGAEKLTSVVPVPLKLILAPKNILYPLEVKVDEVPVIFKVRLALPKVIPYEMPVEPDPD